MAARALVRRVRSEEDGITLVELLVVLLTGTVVALGLFAFQDVTLRQSTRVFANVDATQRARTTMELIETRLRSSCVSENVTPILAGSTDSSISFVSKFGSAASLTPEKHVIALSSGVLTDTTYPATGGTAPNWTFSGTASTTRKLLDHVTTVGSTPVFRYYKYGIAADSAGGQYLDAAGNPFMVLLDGTATLPTGVTTASGGSVPTNTIPYNSAADRSRLPATAPTGLSAADAKLVAAVTITMTAGAAGQLGDYANSRTAAGESVGDDTTMQDSVILRVTPVPSEGNLPTVPPCS
jgi:hypothetical protein